VQALSQSLAVHTVVLSWCSQPWLHASSSEGNVLIFLLGYNGATRAVLQRCMSLSLLLHHDVQPVLRLHTVLLGFTSS
jgi:hypothetical protein